MPIIWENSTLTNKGIALQAKSIVGESINITAVKTGSGSVENYNLKEQTEVSNIEQTLSILDVNLLSDDVYTAKLQVLLLNNDISESYNLRQIGIYANDPDEGEILFAIAQSTEAYKIPSKSESPGFSLSWSFYFNLSSETNITATIDPEGLVTIKLLEEKLSKLGSTENPVFTGTFSVNRLDGSTIGQFSSTAGLGNTASGLASDAVGSMNVTSGDFSHAEGYGNTAAGIESHAEGRENAANGVYSHAEGYKTKSGDYSHSGGIGTVALEYQQAIGCYNDESKSVTNKLGSNTGTAFVVGNGASATEKSNSIRITADGRVYGKQAYAASGADYAEFFEWLDGNPDNEDRRGYFVTTDGKKIRIAEPGDFIAGIVSGNPCIIGNNDECWVGQFERDEFNCFIYEDKVVSVPDPDNPEIMVEKTVKWYKQNPDYDPELEYVERSQRQEWDCVGMMGRLPVRDDGTCQVNGYCTVSNGGIATSSERGYRVLDRISDNIVEIMFTIYAQF